MGTTETSGRLISVTDKALLRSTTLAGRTREEAFETALVLADLLLVWSAAAIAFYVRFAGQQLKTKPALVYGTDVISQHVGVFLLYSLFVVLFCHQRGLHRRAQTVAIASELWSTVEAVTMSTVILFAFIYLGGAILISRLSIVVAVALTYTELVAWRIARRKWFERQASAGIGTRNVLIVGTGAVGHLLQRYIEGHSNLGLAVAGFLHVEGNTGREDSPDDAVLGNVEDFEGVLRRHFIDEVFITVPEKCEMVKSIAQSAREKGISVRVVPELYDGLAWGAPVQHFGLFPTIALHQEPAPMLALSVKRAIDVIVSAFGVVTLSPLLAAVAVAVRLDSRGPILYRSERIGRKGRRFACYKFRTMVDNAEVLKEELVHLNERKGVLFKVRNDPRVTRIGRFLRKYSLDEFPQLWNVLKGEMSLVGPRPPVPGEYSEYELAHLKRLEVTPGITGLWQVEARQDPSFESYINLDTEYIERWSLMLDFKILVKTVFVVVAGTGW